MRLLLLVVVLVGLTAAGCTSDTKTVDVQGTSPWTQWQVAGPDTLGGPTDIWYVKGLLPIEEDGSWVATGYTYTGVRGPSIWTSADGLAWTRSSLPLVTGGTAEAADEIGRVGDTLTILGINGKSGELGLVGWSGTQNSGWSGRVVSGGSTTDPAVELHGVTRDPQGLVAVGLRFDPRDGNSVMLIGSRDGRAWNSRVAPDDFQRLIPREQLLGRGFAFKGKQEVLVGMAWPPNPNGSFNDADGAIWTRLRPSRLWRRAEGIPTLSGPGIQAVTAVMHFKNAFVAVGAGQSATGVNPYAWRSTDGKTWHATALDPDEQNGSALELAISGSRLVAAGGNVEGEVALWATSDGMTWTEVELPAAVAEFSGDAGVMDLAGTPDGKIGLVLNNDVESGIYIGIP